MNIQVCGDNKNKNILSYQRNLITFFIFICNQRNFFVYLFINLKIIKMNLENLTRYPKSELKNLIGSNGTQFIEEKIKDQFLIIDSQENETEFYKINKLISTGEWNDISDGTFICEDSEYTFAAYQKNNTTIIGIYGDSWINEDDAIFLLTGDLGIFS